MRTLDGLTILLRMVALLICGPAMLVVLVLGHVLSWVARCYKRDLDATHEAAIAWLRGLS